MEVYVVLSAMCITTTEPTQSAVKSVVVMFNSEQEFEEEADNFYDSSYSTFNKALSVSVDIDYDWGDDEEQEWVLDDTIEAEKNISKQEAEMRGYVVFKAD